MNLHRTNRLIHYPLLSGHAKCNIEEELLDVKEKCRELSARNSELQSQVASSSKLTIYCSLSIDFFILQCLLWLKHTYVPLLSTAWP